MGDPTFTPTQRASQKLTHGRITWESDNSNIIKLERTPYDPATGPEPAPSIAFVGEGIATYEIKMIYQPTPDSFPCLISNPRYRLRVFWDNDTETYLARPSDYGEINRSQEWLSEGIRTMNAMYDISQGRQIDPDTLDTPSDEGSDSWLNKLATASGNLLGAAARIFFS